MHLSKFPTTALWPGRASRLCGFRFNFRFQIHSTSQPMDSEYALSMDSKSAGQFQLAHTRGSAFFSLRALTPQASANLNVRWNDRTYVFELVESGNPLLSFILETPADQNKVQPAPELSPTGILALLDKAKAFPLLKKQHPDAVADVD